MTGTTGTTGNTPHHVIVVGSGPTGLLLAGDLAAAGVPVTVLEKRPHRISNPSRAFVLHARTLEQLDARGLADELEAVGQPLDRLRLFGRLTVDLATLPSRFNHLLVLAQYEVEKVLERRAVEAGVDFRYETELTGLTQDADGVTAEARGPGGAYGDPARGVRRRRRRHTQCRAGRDRAALPGQVGDPVRRPRRRQARREAADRAHGQRRR